MPSISALKGLIVKAQAGDLAAAYRLCVKKKPRSVNELIRTVYPMGGLTAERFDVLADSYDMWQDENANHL